MPFYAELLDAMNLTERRRTTARLLALREKLDKEIPEKDTDNTVLLATWNIREFDSESYGLRLPEAMLYIAEIVNRFDLVAIQEVRGDLRGLKELRRILGGSWEYLFSDVTEGRPGNDERMAFLYDSRKVRFGGLAGELVLPAMEVREGGRTVRVPVEQVARTPFMAGFKAGWTDFVLATVHILYGTQEALDPNRLREIREVASLLGMRARSRSGWSRNLVLLGDFNIFSKSDATLTAMTDQGFVIPERLQAIPGSNVKKDKFYDQIAFNARTGFFDLADPANPEQSAGVFDFFETVFTEDEQSTYRSYMGEAYEVNSEGNARPETGAGSKQSYYRTYWRTYQMSDHLPMWVKLRIDYTNDYLVKRRDE